MWLIILLSVIFCMYYFLKKNNDYWKNRGIPSPKAHILVGNIGASVIFKKSVGQIFTDIYNDYPDLPFVGVYRGTAPNLLIRDTEFIKNITVKNFKCFHNNDINVDKDIDPIMGRNVFFLRDQEWKDSRSQMTPCFTSGKIKYMYPLLEDVSNKFVKYLENLYNTGPLEAKELCTNFTLNNVASCAFGIEGKCFEGDSEFKKMALDFLNTGTLSSLKLSALFILPSLAKFISIKFVEKKVEDKMFDLVAQTLKYRKENNIVRNDFLHMMSQLMTSNENFTMVDVVGHAAGFIADGFETSSIVLSFVLYEIASHPNVQEKLRREIEDTLEENGGRLTYEAITEMDYLNAVVLESLRRNPPLFNLGKTCTEKYTYETPENSTFKKMSVTIEPGMTLILPVTGLAYDEKIFPNAQLYDPERFTGDNKNNINKYGFLVFGEGPRQCLGQRFGMLQVKVGIVSIVKNFKISVNKKTKEPIQVDPTYFLLKPKGGLWLNFAKIK